MYVQILSTNKSASLDFKNNDYEISFTLTPIDSFSLAGTTNKLFDFGLGVGKYVEKTSNGTDGVTDPVFAYALFTESEEKGADYSRKWRDA